MERQECSLCRGSEIDEDLGREQVWEDDLWRLTTSVGPGDPTAGFSYLEPKRHIANISDLDGAESVSFGTVLARCCSALREATNADHVYVYVFGDNIPHLHLHLAPHVEGDALIDTPIRGEFVERLMPTGHIAMVSKDFPPIRDEELHAVAKRTSELLGQSDP